jgi:lysine-specific histone demethylase 1
MTYKSDDYIADLGAMVITGLGKPIFKYFHVFVRCIEIIIGGNPLLTLARQIPMELQEIKTNCPLFDHSGKPIQKERDDIIEKEFNRLLAAVAHLAHTLDVEQLSERKLSLGESLETVI